MTDPHDDERALVRRAYRAESPADFDTVSGLAEVLSDPSDEAIGKPPIQAHAKPPTKNRRSSYHRTIFAVDIEGSTIRNNSAKAGLRAAMYEMVEQALRSNGITEDHCDPLVDRGDGILALVHPVDEVPKTLLLSHVVPTLSELLAEHETEHGARLRLRAVLHAGEVHNDGRGNYGEALDIAFRLLDAPEVKQTFRMSTPPLLLVVLDLIFATIVRQGYEGIDERAFSPVAPVLVGGAYYSGWVCLPDMHSRPEINGFARPAAGERFLRAGRRFDERLKQGKHIG